jgi:hypothetical protein
MKKLLLIIAALAFTNVSFAMCPDNATKITDRLKAHSSVTAINVTYSADKEAWAKDMKDQIMKIMPTMMVNLVPDSGSDVCKIGRA